jgi:hypothetical protein
MNMSMSGNQTMDSAASDLVPYNNPNLGFSLEYPSDWQKEESLSFTSPQGDMGRVIEHQRQKMSLQRYCHLQILASLATLMQL